MAYKRGQCDEALVECTNKNSMFKLQARYIVERADGDLWLKVGAGGVPVGWCCRMSTSFVGAFMQPVTRCLCPLRWHNHFQMLCRWHHSNIRSDSVRQHVCLVCALGWLWLQVLDEGNPNRRALIDQVVSTALPESRNPEQVRPLNCGVSLECYHLRLLPLEARAVAERLPDECPNAPGFELESCVLKVLVLRSIGARHTSALSDTGSPCSAL